MIQVETKRKLKNPKISYFSFNHQISVLESIPRNFVQIGGKKNFLFGKKAKKAQHVEFIPFCWNILNHYLDDKLNKEVWCIKLVYQTTL